VIKYAITINQAGGTGGTANKTYSISSSAQTVNLGAPTRSGHRFDGWTKTAGPGSVSGNTLTIPANSVGDITVVAQWAASYTITVDKNGGSGGAGNTNYYVSKSAQSIPMAAPSRSGWTFNGWTETGPGTVSGTTLTIPANGAGAITLTAKWSG